jgi:nitrous oxidase accessory protein NosD
MHNPDHYTNSWDDGYPSGGNYWSDYNGTDANHDGIGDTSHVLDANNTDHYPLMIPYIIPEFPSFLFPVLFITATLLTVIIYKRRQAARYLS